MRIVGCNTVAGPGGAGTLVVLRAESGLHGVGESLTACDGLELALPWSLDLSQEPIPQLMRILEPLAQLHAPPVVFAIETALLDLAGRALGKSISALVRGGHAAPRIALNALITGATIDDWLRQSHAASARGIETIKIKIGRRPFADELCDLTALRNSVGPAIALRVDVNGAWPITRANDYLAELVPLALEYVEQPVGANELVRLVNSPIPLAADETLALPGGLESILAAGNCAVAVLKPSRLGGTMRCLALAQRAHDCGMQVVVTHSFEGPVGLAACCELALGLPFAPLACGLDIYESLTAWPQPPPDAQAGPGLGLDDAIIVAGLR